MYRWARVIQAFFSTCVVLFLMLIALRIWNVTAAVVAGLIGAVQVSLIYFTGLLMSESLFVFWLLAFVCLWTAAIQAKRPIVALAAGLTFGAACLTRGMLLVFLPVLLLLTWLSARGTGAWKKCVWLLFGAIIVIAPWTWRNYQVHHALVPITTKSGYNLYIYTYPVESLDFNARFDQIPIPNLDG